MDNVTSDSSIGTECVTRVIEVTDFHLAMEITMAMDEAEFACWERLTRPVMEAWSEVN